MSDALLRIASSMILLTKRTIGASSTSARRNWRIIAPDTGAYQWDFVGFVSKWEWEDVENEKEVAATVEISVDGAVTRTP